MSRVAGEQSRVTLFKMIKKTIPQKLRGRLISYWEKRTENADRARVLNVVEATQFVRTTARLCGISMFDMTVLPDCRVQAKKWNFLGFFCCVTFICLFAWCTYHSTMHRSNIVFGVVYDSILGYYGEHFRTFMSCVFVIYVFVLSFVTKVKVAYWEDVLKIDNRLQEMGVRVDCTKLHRRLLAVVFAHGFMIILLSSVLYFQLWMWNAAMPLSKIFQLMYTLWLTMHCLMTYYYNATIMRDRYCYLNEVLYSVVDSGGIEEIIVTDGPPQARTEAYKEVTAVNKILQVRKLHSLMYSVEKSNESRFGTIVVMMICVSFISTILHIFYLMEATARGLYNDYKRYAFFVGYNAQQILFGVICIFYITYASEKVYSVTSKTAGLVHDIINKNVDCEVTKEASLLSLQLVHERHKYTAKGLFEIDYSFLLSVMGSITTYLIILLQFATNSNMDFKYVTHAGNRTFDLL